MGGGGSRARQQVGAAKISVPAVGDVPQDAGWSQPLQISTTPRRESIEEREGMRSRDAKDIRGTARLSVFLSPVYVLVQGRAHNEVLRS